MGKAVERRVCVHCGCTETPLWRSGPDGQKTLCNADGVRLKKGKLQLYLDKYGNVTANPGPGNKPYNTVAKRKEAKRTPNRRSTSKSNSRVRKLSQANRSASKNTAGKRPFTRGVSRKNDAILDKVLAESKNLNESIHLTSQKNSNKHIPPSSSFSSDAAISSVMKEVYGCFPNIDESQLSFQTDDSYCMNGSSVFDFEEVDSYSGEIGHMFGGDDHDHEGGEEESEKNWDLHAELNQALSPLAASIVDGNGEALAVNDAS